MRKQKSAAQSSDTDGLPTPDRASASPVCYADSASNAYNGLLERDELICALQELLQAERAGAQLATETMKSVDLIETQVLLQHLQRDETRWCTMLIAALRRLETSPSQAVGLFYQKAMNIAEIDARLAYLNRGQSWVVRQLENLIPRVSHIWLRNDLVAMRKAHEINIEKTSALLAERGTIL